VHEAEQGVYGVSRQQYDYAKEMLGDLLEREEMKLRDF